MLCIVRVFHGTFCLSRGASDDFGLFWGNQCCPPLLTDGGDDAAILVFSAVERRQSCNCLLRNLVLGIHRREKDEPKKGKACGIQPAGEILCSCHRQKGWQSLMGVPRDWQRSQGFFPACQWPLCGAGWRLTPLGGGEQPCIIPAPFKPPCQPYQFLLVRYWGAGVAIGVKQELGVAVDGDESLDVPVVLHKVHDGLHLGLRVGVRSVVCL